jgi:hypothetical protein
MVAAEKVTVKLAKFRPLVASPSRTREAADVGCVFHRAEDRKRRKVLGNAGEIKFTEHYGTIIADVVTHVERWPALADVLPQPAQSFPRGDAVLAGFRRGDAMDRGRRSRNGDALRIDEMCRVAKFRPGAVLECP